MTVTAADAALKKIGFTVARRFADGDGKVTCTAQIILCARCVVMQIPAISAIEVRPLDVSPSQPKACYNCFREIVEPPKR